MTTINAAEVDQIDQATQHFHVDNQRIDGGEEPTQIDVVDHGVAERIDVSFGFSMAGEVTAADSSITLTAPSMSPARANVWDGLPAAPGDLWVYGPSSVQVGTHAAGTGSHLVSVPWESLERAAAANHIDLPSWRGKRARLTNPRASRLVEVLNHGFGELDRRSDGVELVRTVLMTLADPPPEHIVHDRRNSSRAITRQTLDWIETNSMWFPSLAELCTAVAVSERRLHYAFVDIFQVPPGRYLRLRALNAVRSELRNPGSLHRSITNVAIQHGFRHPSLFARHYRRTFGETPTETRRRTPALARSGGSLR